MAINNLYGKVTLSLRGTRTLGNQSQIEILNLYIYGKPTTTFSWKIKGSERIETGNQLSYNDVFGTALIFKRKSNILGFEVSEMPNQTTRLNDNTTGASETIDTVSMVSLGEDFKYGKWYVEESLNATDELRTDLSHSGNLRFLFRPNAVAINDTLNTDGVSNFKFKSKHS